MNDHSFCVCERDRHRDRDRVIEAERNCSVGSEEIYGYVIF